MRERESIYAARRQRIRDACRKGDNDRRWRAKSHGDHQTWFDLTHGLAACLHAKVKITLELPFFLFGVSLYHMIVVVNQEMFFQKHQKQNKEV